MNISQEVYLQTNKFTKNAGCWAQPAKAIRKIRIQDWLFPNGTASKATEDPVNNN